MVVAVSFAERNPPAFSCPPPSAAGTGTDARALCGGPGVPWGRGISPPGCPRAEGGVRIIPKVSPSCEPWHGSGPLLSNDKHLEGIQQSPPPPSNPLTRPGLWCGGQGAISVYAPSSSKCPPKKERGGGPRGGGREGPAGAPPGDPPHLQRPPRQLPPRARAPGGGLPHRISGGDPVVAAAGGGGLDRKPPLVHCQTHWMKHTFRYLPPFLSSTDGVDKSRNVWACPRTIAIPPCCLTMHLR